MTKRLWILLACLALLTSIVLLLSAQRAAKLHSTQTTHRSPSDSANTSSNLPKLVTKTFCSDVCPHQTRTFQIYEGIDNPEDCKKIDGQVVKDAGWGGYIGCQPREADEPDMIKG